jgi:predicted DNA-binding transcriptional regulator YafY
MPDEVRLIRQWRLLRILGARHFGVTLREMARETGVTEKTIGRDLAMFGELGFPLEEIVGEHGRKTWKLTAGWGQPPLAFTFDEVVVLYLGRRFLEPLAGTQFWQAANSAMRKIRATLSKPALEYIERFPQVFHCTTAGFGNYASKAEIIDDLTMAIEDRKAVHVTYQSQQATEPATRDVYPYCLVRNNAGALYLFAFSPEHDRINHYKVDRIESVEISSIIFQRPRDFDIEAHLAGSFGIYNGSNNINVVVKFAPSAARYVSESRRHSSQVLTAQHDGSLLARFTLSSTVEFKSWVQSFGASAVVLEPAELRAEIVQELEQ